MTDLKLIALDQEDLAVVSAHLQDAVVKVSDLAYLPRERRFAVVLNRFDWAGTITGGTIAGGPITGGTTRGKPGKHHRVRTALRFERIAAAQIQSIDLDAKSRVLSLLAIEFEPTSPPGGDLTMIFAGGASIRLKVECIEGELRDLGAAWRTPSKPEPPGGGTVGNEDEDEDAPPAASPSTA